MSKLQSRATNPAEWAVNCFITIGNFNASPGGKMPPSTAGRMPAATFL
jgi:hypothetical protein